MPETPQHHHQPAAGAWSSRRRLIQVLLVLLAALAARLPNLGESLWTDEIVYTRVMLAGKSLDWVLFHDVHPPLYALILHGWIGLFGDGEIAVRTPSLLFGLASLVVVYALVRRWFGDRTALLAMILMALSPPHIWYSQENKTNMLVVLLSVTLIWRLQAAWTSNRGRDWILFTAASVLALWAHAFSLFVVLAAFAWLGLQVLRAGGRDRLRGAVVALGLVAAGSLPLVYAFLREGKNLDRGYLRAFTLPEVYKFVLIYLGHGNTLRTISPYDDLGTILDQPGYLLLVDGFFALLILLGIGAAVAHRWGRGAQLEAVQAGTARARGELLLAYFLLPLLALLFASLVYPRIFIERSMLIVLPAFLILIAHGILSLPRPLWRRIAVSVVIAVNAVALHALWVTKADQWTVYKQNPDWRGAVQHVVRAGAGSPSRPVSVVVTTPQAAVSYYLRRAGVLLRRAAETAPQVVIVRAREPDPSTLHQAFTRDGIRVIFFLYNRYWDEDEGRLLARLQQDRRYRFVARTRYKGLEVHEIHRLAR